MKHVITDSSSSVFKTLSCLHHKDFNIHAAYTASVILHLRCRISSRWYATRISFSLHVSLCLSSTRCNVFLLLCVSWCGRLSSARQTFQLTKEESDQLHHIDERGLLVNVSTTLKLNRFPSFSVCFLFVTEHREKIDKINKRRTKERAKSGEVNFVTMFPGITVKSPVRNKDTMIGGRS